MGLSGFRQLCLIRIALDSLALIVSWFVTVEIRLAANPLADLQLDRDALLSVAPPLTGILPLWYLVAWWSRLYKSPVAAQRIQISRVVDSVMLVGVVALLAVVFSPSVGSPFSRLFVLLYVPTTFVMLIGARSLEFVACKWTEKWATPENVAMLGLAPRAAETIESIESAGLSRCLFKGVILPAGSSPQSTQYSVLGTTDELADLINRERLNRILILDGAAPDSDVKTCTQISKRMGVTLTRVFSVAESDVTLQINAFEGLTVLDVRPAYFAKFNYMLKRILDLIGASVLLMVTLPILLIFAALIKLTSSGPILYRSWRVGRGGRYFEFLKFRSMYTGADRSVVESLNEADGHLFKIRKDPRVTSVGRFMRRFSVDELPQLINVVRGEMSLVGPRPLPIQDLDGSGRSRLFVAWSEQRSMVFPGITGLWQIKGRSDLTFEQMMELDLVYLREWSVSLDIRILLATPNAVMSGRGAY